LHDFLAKGEYGYTASQYTEYTSYAYIVFFIFDDYNRGIFLEEDV